MYSLPELLRFDMALMEPVHEMMHRGVKIDLDEMERLRKGELVKWEESQEKLDSILGTEINAGSPDQVKGALYGYLGVRPRTRTDPKTKKKRVTSDEKALRSIMAESRKKLEDGAGPKARDKYTRAFLICMFVLKVRSARKLLSSYLTILLDTDGRMRELMSVNGAETYRFTHSKTLWNTGCNMATIPLKLRTMFVPDEGKVLAEFDLNRGESWIYAFESGDYDMMKIMREGLDFHTISASAISSAFGQKVSEEEIARLAKEGDDRGYKLRFLGKKWNHASAYMASAPILAASVNEEAEETGMTCTQGQAARGLELWHRRYPGIGHWHEEVKTTIRNRRELRTAYGRVRRFHAPWGDGLFREAIAHVPQSTSVEYLNRGLYELWRRYDLPGDQTVQLLHQQHDSVLVQFDEDRTDVLMPRIAEALTSELTINGHDISIPVEGKYGPNWREQEEWAA